ncbi:MAG: ligase-associated DNA damage response DEXH box helicase [Planctomycetota bacterium]|nr:ligase-associated DNA damage response DEXH box helicase [Planctomycetota bacterium]
MPKGPRTLRGQLRRLNAQDAAQEAAPDASQNAVPPKRPRRSPAARDWLLDPHSGIDRLRAWFTSRGWTPWDFQERAWHASLRGESGLIQVATGAGKTFGAYFGPLAHVIDECRATQGPVEGLRILYLTPLRAVSRDVQLALQSPIDDLCLPISVETRTGDTTQRIRAKQRERMPNVLVTTPESLSLLLTRDDCATRFAGLHAVILDEWHELLTSKRGTQTELCLARLRSLAPRLQTWALSATLPNLDEAAQAAVGVGQPATLVRGSMDREVRVSSLIPPRVEAFPWAGHLGLSMLEPLLDAIDINTSTIIFVNVRSQCERWYSAIADARPQWLDLLGMHHGSLERKERERVEQGLKSGSLRLVVATSSLDLGVDFAPVQRVFQIGSPKGIARLIQRAGRASHQPGKPCEIVCVPTHGLELIEISAARDAINQAQVEPRRPLNKPLDVLVQHMVTRALGGGFVADELFDEVRTAVAYRDLSREEFDWALTLVRDGGASLSAYPEQHRVELVDGVYRVTSKRLAQLHRLNVGTITGEATLDVRFLSGKRLGSIEEYFVSALRENQKFVFAGRVLRFVGIRDLTAYVRPATGLTNVTPHWAGTRMPMSESLSAAVRHALATVTDAPATPELAAAAPIIAAQKRLSVLPPEDRILAEICTTREGTHLFLFPFDGRLVHAGIAAILALRLSRRVKATFSTAANDYGLELLTPDTIDFAALLTPDLFRIDTLAEDAMGSINVSQLARLQFREIARVSGLVFQTYPGAPKTARQLQATSSLMYDVFTQFEPDNLLLQQARREVLERQFEQSRLHRCMSRLAAAPPLVVTTPRPTPLGFPLIVERVGATLSGESLADQLRKMQAQWDAQA